MSANETSKICSQTHTGRRPAPPSGRRDSNPRPSPWQGDALPAEPRPHDHSSPSDCYFAAGPNRSACEQNCSRSSPARQFDPAINVPKRIAPPHLLAGLTSRPAHPPKRTPAPESPVPKAPRCHIAGAIAPTLRHRGGWARRETPTLWRRGGWAPAAGLGLGACGGAGCGAGGWVPAAGLRAGLGAGRGEGWAPARLARAPEPTWGGSRFVFWCVGGQAV